MLSDQTNVACISTDSEVHTCELCENQFVEEEMTEVDEEYFCEDCFTRYMI